MRNIEIIGTGTCLPKNKIEINGQFRYRISGEETQLTLATNAAKKALENAKLTINDIDLIVSSAAVGCQPIPCTAALIHEQIAKGTDIPALDINSTCTSFITALDVVSYMIEAGRYNKVLVVSSDHASCALNPNQKESFELFSDGAAAVVIQKSDDKETGIIHSMQRTWSEGAHSTEVRGGLTSFHPKYHTEETKEEYLFDMKGREVLTIAAKKLPKLFDEFFAQTNITIDDIDILIPHQASRALGMIMKRVGIPEDKYIDVVKDYGNMVSVAVPFVFCKALEEGKIKKGSKVVLCGTAAGLTANILLLKI